MKIDVSKLKKWIVEREIDGYISYCDDEDTQYEMIIKGLKELVRRLEYEQRKDI